MNFLDLVYIFVPTVIIPFIIFSARIDNIAFKKWLNTALGLVLSCYLMWEYHVWLYLFSVITCLALIKLVGWRKCHLVTTALVFSLCLVYHLTTDGIKGNVASFDGQLPRYMFIKLIALSYDIHITNKRKYSAEINISYSFKSAEEEPLDLSFGDLFHYTFSLGTMISGALIRYRTYRDYLHLPFARSCKRWRVVVQKIVDAITLILVTTFLQTFFPIEYTLTEEFRGRHFLYKNIYNFLLLNYLKAYLSCFLGITECIGVTLGMGAYPTSLKSTLCVGPTKDYSHFKNISREEADKLEYDFETIRTHDLLAVFFCPWHAKSWKSYNKLVQYFMGTYINKELFGSSGFGKYRTILTMLMTAFWHGSEIGWYIGLALCGVLIIAERPYYKMLKYTSGWGSRLYLVAMWLVQAHIFSHISMSIFHLRLDRILVHASAMNYVPYISLLIYFVTGKVMMRYLETKNSLKDK